MSASLVKSEKQWDVEESSVSNGIVTAVAEDIVEAAHKCKLIFLSSALLLECSLPNPLFCRQRC
jgi:hypothetical protein